ncbi:uncharacterized protein BDW47DRAFT_103733 [Aspergillus candidus]|uniref:Uncharacterized protein n=1 Tax=Aspergillus candidus TaxID=41067 RepID=A0A2I2FEX2_ASPCN|nr:hypothetical protein BDW47DRAFT_103733 [Aspergillus candidus]PLB39129.1 hypothetical protein BDW47DRAFT_103733 [Aspergillus candidus]
MTVLSLLCGCFRRPTDHPPQDHPHEHRHPRDSDPDPTQHGPAVGSDPPTIPESGDAGYAAITPLPAYTPHPVEVREKTLEAHLRDPPLSSESFPHHTADPDAKSSFHHHHYYYTPHFPSKNNEDLTSDVSSAVSFTSSYGNTSTATRETPPPPYSPRGVSPSPSWRLYRQQWANTAANSLPSSSSTASSRRHSRSMSVSSATSLPYPGVPPPAPVPPLPPLPMAQVTPPRPVLRRGLGVGRRSVEEMARRYSWESR